MSIEVVQGILIPFAGTGFGRAVLAQVEGNGILSFLYHKNILIYFLMQVAGKTL